MNPQPGARLERPLNFSDAAAFYGRVSTSKQDTTTQEERGKEYLRFKQIPLGAEFYDDDTSGSIPIWQRPQGRLLRLKLEAGGIKHLVVSKLDRLGRSASDLLNTVEYLDSIGVVLHIVDLNGDSLSTQGASGRLMLTVLAGMAEFERALIKSRINETMESKRGRGELCGTVPYGWNAVETGAVTNKGVKVRRLEPNPDEQKWILVMKRLRDARQSYGKIASHLNANQVPTKRGRGEVMKLRARLSTLNAQPSTTKFTSGKWQAGNVAKVLNSKTTAEWLASVPAEQAA
jgi:DNA invertase Pin-like site-specific DNA recombinase